MQWRIGSASWRSGTFALSRDQDEIGLDWIAMMGMRNRLFDGYRDTNLVTLWKTVKIDLPEVVSLIEPFLQR
jgi:uncharacterized protein with HEPN domain